MPRVVDITSSERYQWGLASEGWHLLNRPELSVIKNACPRGTASVAIFIRKRGSSFTCYTVRRFWRSVVLGSILV